MNKSIQSNSIRLLGISVQKQTIQALISLFWDGNCDEIYLDMRLFQDYLESPHIPFNLEKNDYYSDLVKNKVDMT